MGLQVSNNLHDFSNDFIFSYTSAATGNPCRDARSTPLYPLFFEWRPLYLPFTPFLLPPLTVSMLSPAYGTQNGATLVMVRGTGFFDSPASACRFGSVVVTPQEVIDSTAMVCRTPPHGLGKVLVEVTMNGDSFTTSGATFEYHPTVTLASVSPHMGPVSGNTVVEVHGSGFVDSPLLACRFGKLALVPAVFDTSSHVTCVTPAMSAGIQGVEVTTNGVDLSANGLQFFVEAPPQVYRDTHNASQW